MARTMFRRKARRCPRDHNKIIFKDELSAKIALAKQRDNNNREAVPRRAYQCKHGKHYHLTSKSQVRESDAKGTATAGVKSAENASRIGRVASASRKAASEGSTNEGNRSD